MGRPRRLALDANALATLSDGGKLGAAALKKLTYRVKHGEVQLIAGYALMAEVAVLASRKADVYTRQMRALRELARNKLLLPYTLRISKEAARRGLLTDFEAFQKRKISTVELARWKPTDDPVIHRATVAARQKAEYENSERETKELYREFSDDHPKERREWLRIFEEKPDDVIDDWVKTEIFEKRREKYALPSNSADLPAPRQVPSARADLAYHIARAYLQIREWERHPKGKGRKIKPTDYFDNVHFIDAMYAHEFVTSDAGFHEIVSHAGNTGVVMSHFNDWATRFLSER